jgi:hypothetical protein
MHRGLPKTDLASQLARLDHRDQECVERILRLTKALRALLEDYERCLKDREPAASPLRDIPTALREARAALEDYPDPQAADESRWLGR